MGYNKKFPKCPDCTGYWNSLGFPVSFHFKFQFSLPNSNGITVFVYWTYNTDGAIFLNFSCLFMTVNIYIFPSMPNLYDIVPFPNFARFSCTVGTLKSLRRSVYSPQHYTTGWVWCVTAHSVCMRCTRIYSPQHCTTGWVWHVIAHSVCIKGTWQVSTHHNTAPLVEFDVWLHTECMRSTWHVSTHHNTAPLVEFDMWLHTMCV